MVIVYIFFFSSRRRHTRYWRDWSSDVCSSDLNRRSVVEQLEWLAGEQLIARLLGANVDPEPPALVQQPEAQPGKGRGQARSEGEDVAVIAEAAEPGDRDEPGAGQRGQVQTVGGIAREIVQIDKGRLAEVVEREVEVPDLGGEDRLDGRRER